MTRLQREASFDDDEFDAADDASTSSSPLETRKQLRAVRRMLKGTTIYFQAASPRDVVLTNAVASGCSVVHKPELADLIWIEAMPMAPDYIRQLEHQRINFFPGMKAAATKCEFARLMGRVARLYPGEFDFIPKTFALPMEQKLLDEYLAQEASRKQVFVVKPDAGCGGDGIYLSDDVKKTARHPECVVQEYITNPLTIGGLKFDLRLYVAVTSIYPLRFYLHREGLGRMAVEPYEEPNRSNFYRLNMHLTNYSLNKFSNKFVENTDALDDAHTTKRRATTAFQQLAAEYPDFDFDSVWSDITELVGKVLASITPHLLACAGDVPGATRYTSRCFQLLGFDVLLDRDFKPHLLEINHHPSLQTDAPIDFYVKERVVRPLVRMVALDARLRRRATASKQPFVVPSAEEAAEWEAQFVDSEVGWCPCDAADVDSLTNRFVAPFLPMINCFIDACGASGRKYEALTASRFVKLMRKVGLCGPGRQFSSAEADLLFIKCMQQIGSNAFGFFDLIDAMLTTIGDKVSPHTPPMSLVRLRDVTTTLTSDAA